MTDTQRKQRTITLTGNRPVAIYEDEWPVIASSGWSDYDNQYEFQANRKADARLKVRKHEDGRSIVYGTYRYRTNFQNEDDVHAAAGRLLGIADGDSGIFAAIRSVTDCLSSYDSLPGNWQPDWRLLADQCIADLPAEQL
jgi:hypothetical protein